MKKALMALCVALACSVAFAQESAPAPASAPVAAKASTKAAWPVWLAFNSAKDIDVIGLRLTLPYGKCESVTGFDLGIYGSCRYFEGLQVNILRNEAVDVMAGIRWSCRFDGFPARSLQRSAFAPWCPARHCQHRRAGAGLPARSYQPRRDGLWVPGWCRQRDSRQRACVLPHRQHWFRYLPQLLTRQ